MAALPIRTQRLTLEDYVRIEQETGLKHEFYDGEVFLWNAGPEGMAGGSERHALVAANLIRHLGNLLADSDCFVYGSDLRVRVPADDMGEKSLDTYPDASVVCGEKRIVPPADTLLNPVLLVEVLSPSTEAYDRGTKFELYRRIPSLREVVFAVQDRRAVEVYRRGDDGRWTLYEPDSPTGTVELASLGVVLSIDGVYAKVGLDPRPPLHPRSGEGAAG